MKMKGAACALLMAAAAFLTGCTEDVSVGVIGGADGPTAVFVTAAPFWWVPFALIGAAIAAVIAAVILRRRKKG